MRQLRSDWRIVVVYLVLFSIGIPWYWPEDNLLIILGMPAWVTIAIAVSVLISVVTAYLLLNFTWPGEQDSSPENDNE